MSGGRYGDRWEPRREPLLCHACKRQIGVKGDSPVRALALRATGEKVYVHEACARGKVGRAA